MQPEDFFKFYSQVYKLKLTLRHCWLGAEHRRESVADHTWALTLFAAVIIPELTIKVDTLKVIKMLIYHDLAEAVTGDIPATVKSTLIKSEVVEAERKALEKLVKPLSKELQTEIIGYWEEFELAETNEAIVANAMDKAEAIMQHAFSDIETWEDKEHALNANYEEQFFNTDPYLRKLKDYINNYCFSLSDRAGRLDLLTEEQRAYWKDHKSKFDFRFFEYK